MAATTRIFVRNLPPSITEDDFRSHFSQRYSVTDVKLLAHRRFGYVGLKTTADAVAAVKYFNKSFMRMSRLNVELADSSTPLTAGSDRSKGKAAIASTKRKHPANESFTKAGHDSKRPRLESSKPQSAVTGQDVQLQAAPREFPETSTQPTDPNENPLPPGVEAADPKPREADSADEAKTDEDWIRSRTSRLLGLMDEGNGDSDDGHPAKDTSIAQPTPKSPSPSSAPDTQSTDAASQRPTGQEAAGEQSEGSDEAKGDTGALASQIRENGRLFLRNLSYSVTAEDLRASLEPFGPISEIHLPLDLNTGASKGFAFVQFSKPDDAVDAFEKLDGTILQGRLLHVLPAADRRDTLLDEQSIANLPLKRQKQIQRKADASSSFRWNSIYMNSDAVIGSVADRLGVSKADIVDPTSSSAAVRQAQAETHVIQETKTYFEMNGVKLEAFGSPERSDTAILVKNFKYGTTPDDLKTLFSKFGEVVKLLMPPSGTIAIVAFQQPVQARAAFRGLAYRKLGDSVLFLEKAPKDIFNGKRPSASETRSAVAPEGRSASSTSDLLEPGRESDLTTSTLFVRNLSFSTTNERFQKTFEPIEGFVSGRVKTKPDPKRPGQTLSMGFGFVEFRTAAQAEAALTAMDGFVLDGHHLLVRASHKNRDMGEEQRLADKESKKKLKKSKIVIKNLPFEVTKKDIRGLLTSYGQLRTVRVPRKFDSSRRGYAFAEFTTAREAESAMDALHDTHLLGRRLVLEYASGEAEDPEAEIARMQHKIGKQSDSVAMNKLALSSARRKFLVADDNDELS